jgi:hypothetical protein
MQMAPYAYTELNQKNEEIRLIGLFPGQWDDQILCEVFHTPLLLPKNEFESKRLPLEDLRKGLPKGCDVGETVSGRYLFWWPGRNEKPNSWDHPNPKFDRALYELQPQKSSLEYEPRYEALSYTWGSTTKSVVLYVLGRTVTTLEIGATLATALRHLRYLGQSRTLWVDAICINQDDVLERNHEVNRMRTIYSLAKRTIIWLGEEADDSTRAMLTPDHFAKQVEFMNGAIGDAPGAENVLWWRSEYRLPYDESTWSCLLDLLRRPWFSRVWVLQEALLGNQMSIVQCGKTSLLWPALRKAILVLSRNITAPHELRSLLASYRPGLLPRAVSKLPELLSWAKRRQCTDPRDKIYGVLGLVSPLIEKGIRLDYLVPTPQIYMSALLSYISITKQLNLIQHCRVTQCFNNEPSWIPNWAFDDESTELGSELGRYAANRSSAQARYIAPNILEVIGVCCASISSVSINASGSPKEIFQAIRRWELEGLRTKGYIAGGSLFDAFLETIFQGQTIDRYPSAYHRRSLRDILATYEDASSMHARNEEAILSIISEHFECVTFFTTQEGYLGVTVPGVEKSK